MFNKHVSPLYCLVSIKFAGHINKCQQLLTVDLIQRRTIVKVDTLSLMKEIIKKLMNHSKRYENLSTLYTITDKSSVISSDLER